MATSDLRHSAFLTQAAEAIHNEATSYVADRVLPPFESPADQVKFYRIGGMFGHAVSADFGRRPAQGTFDRIVMDISQVDAATIEEYGIEAFYDDFDARNASDNGLSLRLAATKRATEALMIAKERFAAALLFSTTTFATYTEALAGADRWDDASSSPVTKVQAWGTLIRRQIGQPLRNLSLLVGAEPFDALARHPELLEQFKYTVTGSAMLNAEQVAQALRVKEVIVGDAVYETAKEGAASSKADIWGKFALLYYKADRPEPMSSHGIGFTAVRQGEALKVEEYREEPRHNVVVASALRKQVVTNAAAGYLGSTVVS